MTVNVFVQIAVMGLLLESLIQTVKPIWKPTEATVSFYVSLAVGMILSAGITFLAGLDLFAAAGIPLVKAPWVGVICTGLLLSRGSNFIHDLLGGVLSLKEKWSSESK